MSARVVISKKWKNPEITVAITDEELSLSMSMENFLRALIIEMKSNSKIVLTRGGLESLLNAAAEEVLHHMKKESVHVK